MEDKISSKDALAVNLWTLRLSGAWIADINDPKLRFLYNVYGTVIILFLTVAYYSTEIIYITIIWGDLESISEILFLLLTHVGTAVKLINLLLRRGRIQKLVEDLYRKEFIPKNIDHFKFLESTIKRANIENIIFCLMCTSTVMAWAIVPLVEKREESVRRLPLKTWFPFDTSDSPIFEVIYVYQIVAVEMNACMNAMMDTFASVMMALAGAQLDMLRKDLSDLGSEENFMCKTVSVTKNFEGKSRVVRERGFGKDKVNRKVVYMEGEKENEEEEEEEEEEGRAAVAKEFPCEVKDDISHRRIVGCIEHHGAIIRFTHEIQEVFGIGILVQFAVSSTILCLTCFELTLTSPASLKFYSMLLYQTCMLFQIYCYCWHGNGIIVKTSKLITTAFHCQWTSCTPKFKTTLLIMMCRMQRPMQLMVGGLFGLSLETFSMILRTAYSFYAVIQRVHNGENGN